MTRSQTLTSIGLAMILGCASAGGKDGDPGSDYGSNGGGDDGSGSGSGSGDNTQPTYPQQHPRIYLGANRARLAAALTAKTPAATRFKTAVDNWVNGADLWGFQSWNAALMGQLTNDPKYCTKAIATVESQVSAAESAISGGGTPAVAGDSYLEIGPMIGDLALVYDWCFDAVTADQRTRWLAYANQAIWNVWHHDQAKWGSRTVPWTGWAVDDPSDNYFYQFMRATMLVGLAANGENAQADGWLTQFRETKILGELVPTFNADLVGGGSREGTGYGLAMAKLFELYDIWHATTGENLANKSPHARASLLAFVHQIVPTDDRVAPTGDQSRDSTASFFDYHRNYMQELIAMYSGDPLAARAKTVLDTSSVPQMANSFMVAYDFLYDDAGVNAVPVDLGTAYYASGIGQLYARSGWDKHATWLNFTAGPYTQSHAHQDQGAFMIYKDGWLAYDPVIDSHSGLPQQVTAHSVMRIDNGGSPIGQVPSTISNMVALHRGTGWLHAAGDLTPAYDGNAAVGKVQRELVYLEPDVVVVFDRVTTAAGTQQTWQLASPVQPTVSGANATFAGAHQLHVQRLAPAATASVHAYTSDSDFSGGYRLDETMPGGDQRYLHVLSIDGAAQSVTAAGPTGVTIQLATGHTATITFSPNAVGGTLVLDGATTTLAAGVDNLPR